MRNGLFITGIGFLIIFAFLAYNAQKTVVSYKDAIKIYSPSPDSLIESPIRIRGEARGYWYFEASFPVRLFDGNGGEIAVMPAQAEGEWMTNDYVPFNLILKFEKPETPIGTLVLEKDNPSGLLENADQVTIPVKFR